MSMGIKEKILTTVYHFYTYLKGTYVTNLTSTSSDVPLAASQGKALNDAIIAYEKSLHPVGSIYITADNNNPGNFISGTTWVLWGADRIPVCVDANNSLYNASEKTGGATTVSLTTANMAAHTHVCPNHEHASGTHTHSGLSHTHLIPAHSHNHTHTIPALSGSASSVGAHTHTLGRYSNSVSGSGGTARPRPDNNSAATTKYTSSSAGAHTHLLVYSMTTSSNAQAASTTVTGSSGNCTTGSTNAGSVASAGNVATGEYGTAASVSISIVQPYITCYMWKRTA